MRIRTAIAFTVLALVTASGAQAQQWWDGDWSHRRPLVFDAASITQPLVDFPVLVAVDSSRIDYLQTQDSGADIHFVDADGVTALSHEIEKWNESGISYVWVKIPQVDQGSTTDMIWMYYGNGSVSDGQDAAGVWSNGYVGVWHLDETSGTHDDSTSYANTGSSQGNTVHGATGQIDGADDFDGNGDGVVIPSAVGDELSAFTELTLETWVHIDNYANNVNLIGKAYGTASPFSIYTLALGDGTTNFYIRVSTDGGSDRSYGAPNSVSESGFYYLAGTWDGATLRCYVDGNATGSPAFVNGAIWENNNDLDLGRFTGGLAGYDLDGILDEARVSNTARDVEWIAKQHASMTDAFITYGAEEAYAPPGGFSLVDPTDGELDVELAPTLDWNDSTDWDSYTVQVSTEAGFSSGLVVDQSGLLVSTYDVPAIVLSEGTIYYWRVIAVNPQDSTVCSDTYFTFTTMTTPSVPGAFLLANPTDEELDVVLEPTLDWGDSAGADSYTVQVSTETGFSTGLVVDQAGLLVSTYDVPVSALSAGTIYYWRVTAVNVQGSTLCGDTYFTFTTAPLPGGFSLVDPTDDEIDVALEPTLDWNDSSDADSYTVQVATDSGFSDLVVDQTGIVSSTYLVPSSTLDPGVLHYWRVTAENAQGSTLCDDVQFEFTSLPLPGSFILLDPPSTAVGVSLEPTLDWSDSSDVVDYTVWVATDTSFTGLVVNGDVVVSSAYDVSVSVLVPGTTYYWKAVAGNSSGATVPTNGYLSFTTAAAELNILSIVPSEEDPDIGTPISVTVTIQNTGDVAAAAFSVGLFLKPDTPPVPGDVPDVSLPIGLLATGTAPLPVQFTSLDGSALETWRIYAIVDNGSAVVEGNEVDNVAGPVSVTWHGPDIVAPRIEPNNANPNAIDDLLTIYVTVLNLGDRDVTIPFEVSLFHNEAVAPSLGDDPTLSPDGGSTQTVSALAAGQRETLTFEDIPNMDAEVWSTWVIVDNKPSGGDVHEGSESNNVGGPATIAWQPVPDLVVLDLRVYDSLTGDPVYEPDAGTAVDVEVTVRNRASAGTGAFELGLYYDLDSPPTPSDTADAVLAVLPLAEKREATVTFEDVLGPATPEVWRAYVLVDWTNVVEESNELNNVAGPVEINWGAQSGIVIEAPNGAEVWDAGSVRQIAWSSYGDIGSLNVALEYSIDGGTNWRSITGSTPDDGAYDWVVPSADSVECLVRASAVGGQTDQSDATFAIVPPIPRANLRIMAITPSDTEPALVDIISIDVTVLNAGDAAAGIFFVDLFYDRSSPPSVGEIGDRSSFVNGLDAGESFEVHFTNVTAISASAWSTYAVCDTQEYESESNEQDNVAGPVRVGWDTAVNGLRLLSPNGGEQLIHGEECEVRWTGTVEAGTSLYVEYSIDGGMTWESAASDEVNDGIFMWNVPTVISDECRLRVGTYSGSTLDVSDGVFSIRRPMDFFGGGCAYAGGGGASAAIPFAFLLAFTVAMRMRNAVQRTERR